MRPVRAGLCRLQELRDGTYDLADVALFNELLDVEEENQRRASEVK